MIPLYEDSEGARPLIYIDQNIIDSLRKGVYSFGEDVFSKRFRAIYSDETLREIRRAEQGGGNPARYLEVLQKLGAYHLQLQLNGQFAPTGNAIIRTHNPTEAYESFMQQIDLDYLIEANLLINQKIMGGLPELTVEDIAQRMLEAFERNAKSIEQNIKNLETFFQMQKKSFDSCLTRLVA
ncbi:MAG: hypothetical protein JKX89_09445 [Idiomarina sp.]|nr:hypothetical protein [Idiomarina sp.]